MSYGYPGQDPYQQQPQGGFPPGYPQQQPGFPQPAYGGYAAPAPYGGGQLGKIRPTGMSMLLFFITCGIYGIFWWFFVHEEMKKHSGQGIGGVLALILALFISPVAAFMTSDEVGKLYGRRGQQPPVNAMTGLWYFPGVFLIFLPIVWFVKTNNALNDYWRSLGAQG